MGRSVSDGRMVCGLPEAGARHPDTFQNAAKGFTKRGYFGERPYNDGRIFRKTKITGRRHMKKLYVIGEMGLEGKSCCGPGNVIVLKRSGRLPVLSTRINTLLGRKILWIRSGCDR